MLLCLAPGRVCPTNSLLNQRVRSYRTVSPLPTYMNVSRRFIFCGTFHGLAPPLIDIHLPRCLIHTGVRTFLSWVLDLTSDCLDYLWDKVFSKRTNTTRLTQICAKIKRIPVIDVNGRFVLNRLGIRMLTIKKR